MRQIVQRMTVAALALMLALPLIAEDAKDAKKKKEKGGANGHVMGVFKLPKEITLTAEQQPKFDEVKKEFEGKLTELGKKQADILTAEQKEARAAASKAAKAAGKKGKEMKAEVDAAVKMTDEQKKQAEEVGKEIKEIHAKVREKLSSILTDEQKTHLKTPGKKKDKATA